MNNRPWEKRERDREVARLVRIAVRLDALECECGRPKLSTREAACSRCLYLDGEYEGESLLIDALRVGVEMTCAELATEFGIHPSGMLTRLKRLIDRGRVRRYLREGDAKECTQRCQYGTGVKTAVRTGASWVYVLCDRRAA